MKKIMSLLNLRAFKIVMFIVMMMCIGLNVANVVCILLNPTASTEVRFLVIAMASLATLLCSFSAYTNRPSRW